MITLKTEHIPVTNDQDTIFLKKKIAFLATGIQMGLVNQTKLLTAASELMRNMLRYAGGGNVLCEVVAESELKTGIKLTFTDHGPGIKNINEAMKDGFSSVKSLGVGLPGAKRLVNEFSIVSELGKGTRVSILKWKNG